MNRLMGSGMKTSIRTFAPLALVLLTAAAASAAPVYLRCYGTHEVANIAAGAHISYPDTEYLKIDSDNHFFGESWKPAGPWANICNRGGADCRFSERAFTLTTGESENKLSLSVSRTNRRFRRTSDDGTLMSLTEGTCDETQVPDPMSPRQF